MSDRATLRQCLTVAGSDSGAGAGMQADLKAFSANGVYGVSVVTSITAQNTRAVLHAHDLPVSVIQRQLEAVWDDFEISALKTGMLSSAAIVETVAAFLEGRGVGAGSGSEGGVGSAGAGAGGVEAADGRACTGAPPLVVDPVMISKSGFPLLAGDAVEAVRSRLLPLAFLVTPNRHEAELLSGVPIRTAEDLPEVAARILGLGPRTVLLKGGHLEEEEAADYLYGTSGTTSAEPGAGTQLLGRFTSPRFETTSTHGTGCTFSAAICAHLALGRTLVDAVAEAKVYIREAIRNGLAIGHGHGPTDHFYFLRDRTGENPS